MVYRCAHLNRSFSSFDCDHQPNGSQPDNTDFDIWVAEQIMEKAEERESMNAFLNHYELFCEEIEQRGYAGDRIPLYTAYLTQRRDVL